MSPRKGPFRRGRDLKEVRVKRLCRLAITEREYMGRILSAERQILEMIARGLPFEETLITLIRKVEDQIPGSTCRVVTEDSADRYLDFLGTPSSLGEHILSGENRGMDFQTLTRFWYSPIWSSSGNILGNFVTYRQKPRVPCKWEKQLLEMAAHLAGIIIERGKWEIALRESEKRYRNLFQQSPMGLIELDISRLYDRIARLKKSGITSWEEFFDEQPEVVLELEGLCEVFDANRAYLDLYEVECKEDLPSGLKAVFGDQPGEILKEGLVSIAEGSAIFEGETIVTAPNREIKYISFRWSTLKWASDGAWSLIVSVIDITDLKALERERNNISAMFAHDMRSSLVIIQGFVMRLLNPALSICEDKRFQYLNIIRREAAKIKFMMSDFLELTRLQDGVLQLEMVPTSLDRELQELIETYEDRALKCKVKFGLKNLEILPVIEADAKRLRRVFANLIENALKFSRPYSTIFIEAREDEDFIAIRIVDQGIGIDREDLPYIFDPFHRGGTAKKACEGWGVGLAAAKSIVAAHGGQILVESEKGKGSVFTVILPKGSAIYGRCSD